MSFLLALLLSSPIEASGASDLKDAWQNVRVSWAAGVVVPDHSPLEGGSPLSWESVTNLTGVFQLPNITRPSGIVYALLSAMGDDRSVFQVGVGVWPDKEYWSVYSWLITGLDSKSPSYKWMANSSTPQSSPGDVVSASIFWLESGWMFSVANENTGMSARHAFPATPAGSFASGDQEVFALESYSQSQSTFADMGNMTLRSLYVDGQRVVGGLYAYGGWDGIHRPLFVVGSTDSPYFIRLAIAAGQAVWSLDAQWRENRISSVMPALLVLASGALVTAVVFVAHRLRAPKNRRS